MQSRQAYSGYAAAGTLRGKGLDSQLRAKARIENLSEGERIATVIRERLGEGWHGSSRPLWGGWDDLPCIEDFPSIEELRDDLAEDSEREPI